LRDRRDCVSMLLMLVAIIIWPEMPLPYGAPRVMIFPARGGIFLAYSTTLRSGFQRGFFNLAKEFLK
jgi:hypothetical protein